MPEIPVELVDSIAFPCPMLAIDGVNVVATRPHTEHQRFFRAHRVGELSITLNIEMSDGILVLMFQKPEENQWKRRRK